VGGASSCRTREYDFVSYSAGHLSASAKGQRRRICAKLGAIASVLFRARSSTTPRAGCDQEPRLKLSGATGERHSQPRSLSTQARNACVGLRKHRFAHDVEPGTLDSVHVISETLCKPGGLSTRWS
jgi:hypothetical protein